MQCIMVVNNELEGMWKEATAASFKALAGHLPERSEKYEAPQSRQLMSWSKLE
jgi:hypothetical protein